MVKHEIKVELDKAQDLSALIQKAYYDEGFSGKILHKDHYLTITPDDDINWTIFNGLNNVTVKITNQDIIDGTMRFVIEESNQEIRLYPISIYCIKEEERYIFY